MAVTAAAVAVTTTTRIARPPITIEPPTYLAKSPRRQGSLKFSPSTLLHASEAFFSSQAWRSKSKCKGVENQPLITILSSENLHNLQVVPPQYHRHQQLPQSQHQHQLQHQHQYEHEHEHQIPDEPPPAYTENSSVPIIITTPPSLQSTPETRSSVFNDDRDRSACLARAQPTHRPPAVPPKPMDPFSDERRYGLPAEKKDWEKKALQDIERRARRRQQQQQHQQQHRPVPATRPPQSTGQDRHLSVSRPKHHDQGKVAKNSNVVERRLTAWEKIGARRAKEMEVDW